MDILAGGGFRIELEKSPALRPARGLNGCALFFQLLTPKESEEVLEYQNDVIRGLPDPPAAHVRAVSGWTCSTAVPHILRISERIRCGSIMDALSRHQ